MTCPDCEYHKSRAAIWRHEAYRIGGTPLPWDVDEALQKAVLAEREACANKGKANDHIPSPNPRNWVLSLADVEDNDPKKTHDEETDHYRSKPLWALLWNLKGIDALNWSMSSLFAHFLADS